MSFTFFTDRNLGNQFPDALIRNGLSVERHDAHFGPTTSDEEWIAAVAKHGWVAVSRDSQIRYKPNERDAVRAANLRLLVVVGIATHSELAENFVRTLARIERFLRTNKPPFIAKVYRASPRDLDRKRDASGSIERWVSW